MWAGWRLKQWGGGGAASGPLLEAYHNKWAITPCGEGAWSDYSSYPCPRVMKLSFPPLLCDHTGRLGIMTRGSHLHCRLLFPFLSFPLLSFLLCLSPRPFPEPIPFPCCLLLPGSHTQPELWVHSPLIHWQSYLSSGTIATERAQLRAAACRKIAALPQDCGTLRIQRRQPSSLSLLHIKPSSLRVEKRFQLLCVWLSSKWNFYYCSVIDGAAEWLIASVLGVALSVCWSTARLFVCSLRSCAS